MSNMSRYVGWNDATERVCRGTAQEALIDSPVAIIQTLRSFTPVSKCAISTAVVNHGTKRRSQGLDGDKMFEVPEDPLPAPLERKRRRKKLNKSAQPKNRASHRLSNPWAKTPRNETSQLSTPPESRKESSSHFASQDELFSDISITKPLIGPLKLTTTEAVVKAGIVSLGQTTMDKLASFRHKGLVQPPSSTESCVKTVNTEEAVEVLGKENSCHIVNCHDLTSNKKDHPGASLGDHGPKDAADEDSYDYFDDAIMLEYDDDLFVANGRENHTTTGLAPPVEEPNSEDEYPIDDDLKNGMIQISIPSEHCEDICPDLRQFSCQSNTLQCNYVDDGGCQNVYTSSCMLVGNDDSTSKTKSSNELNIDSDIILDVITSLFDDNSKWPSILDEGYYRTAMATSIPSEAYTFEVHCKSTPHVDQDDHSPLKPFARPPFPLKVLDRSPIIGISSKIILRTCFRIGEAIREGAICERTGQDTIIEIFARVMESSHAITSSKIRFELADIFHNRPPFLSATFENNKVSRLQDTEARMLLKVNDPAPMARCLGRLIRVISGPPSWMLHIISIRQTDWEEVRWTKEIAGAGMVK